eukprot:595103_1
MSECVIERNDANYLMNLNVSGDTDIRNCNINNNDIDISLIDIAANYGAFVMTQTNITDNKNMPSSSMQSLVNINRISSVDLSTLRITNNYAAQYLTFDGDSSGDFTVDNIAVIDNVNNGPFAPHALINATRYIKASILNSAFINNDNATVLLEGSLNDTLMIATCSFLHNDYLDTLVNIEGISSLTLSDLIVDNNTAVNGLLFDGQSNGDVNVTNFAFINNNIANAAIDGETLLQFNGFVSLSVDQCQLSNNDGDHLLKAILSDDITFDRCNINGNDIDMSLIDGASNGGTFTMRHSNITNNRNDFNNSFLSFGAAVRVTHIGSVVLSDINIINNDVAQYLIFGGMWSGNFAMDRALIMENNNYASNHYPSAIMIEGDKFWNATITNSHFINNDNGITLLKAELNGSLSILDSTFVGNDDLMTLVNMNGVSSLTMNAVTADDNTATNGILFDGRGSGSVTIIDFEFIETNYIDTLIDGDQAMQFNNFIHFAMSECVIERNDANYLMNLNVSGDTDISNCNINNNDIDISLIDIAAHHGALTLSSINVTNHRNKTMMSLFHADAIGTVSITDLNIRNNYAAEYIGLEGTSSGDLRIKNTRITDNNNLESTASLIDTLIEANHFRNGAITNCEFVNNNNGRNVFIGAFDGDFDVENVVFTNNDGINDTLVAVDGVSTLTVNGLRINGNNAPNGISFNGTNRGPAIIEEFEFNNHNYGDVGDTLIQIINFIDLSVTGCSIERMSGNHLFNAAINGDISISNCNINNNDIAISLINIVANYSAFAMTQTNITNNKNNISSTVVQSMQSLVNINRISSVNLSALRITDNYAAQYLTFDGDSMGHFTMDNVAVLGNTNNGPFPSNAMINATNYIEAAIHHSDFVNNDNATVLFDGVLNGSLSILDSTFIDNDELITLVDVNGISSLEMTAITVSNNTATNGILFRGTSTGNVDVSNFVFEYNNDDPSINGETLILFDSFIDLSIDNCNVLANDGDYLFKGTLLGDIVISNCIIDQNDIDYGLIHIDGAGDGDFIFTSSRITRNRALQGANTVDSLINITYVSSVTMQSIVISDNFAQNYLTFNGKQNNNGNLIMQNVQISNNTNIEGIPANNVLVLANRFTDATINDSAFDHNTFGMNLLTLSISNDLMMNNVSFIGQNVTHSLMDVDGMSSLTMNA